MNGYGGMSASGGTKYMDKIIEVHTPKDDSGNGRGFG